MNSPLSIVLHAPDAEGLQRARLNATNALTADPQTEVRIIANAAAVAVAINSPNDETDNFTYLCPRTLESQKLESRQPLKVLTEPAVLAMARLQKLGVAYIRS